jgi:ParB family chromosome partitioning protein
MAPTLVLLSFAGVAHAQGTMDFSGAQTLMGTFRNPSSCKSARRYGQQQEGSATLPRNKYTEIRPEKPTTKEQATRPEFNTCQYTTEAIVS